MEQYLRDRIDDNIRDTTILDTLIREVQSDYEQCAKDLNKLCLAYADSAKKEAGYTSYSDWATGLCLGEEDTWLDSNVRSKSNPNYWGVTDSAVIALCGGSLASLIEVSS